MDQIETYNDREAATLAQLRHVTIEQEVLANEFIELFYSRSMRIAKCI